MEGNKTVVPHTPTPWHIDRGDLHAGHIAYVQTGAQGESIEIWSANVVDGWNEETAASVNEANASYILRACNSHEALVKALKRSLEAFEDTKLLLEQGLAKREQIIRSVEVKANAAPVAVEARDITGCGLIPRDLGTGW